MQTSERRVVITGLGLLSPTGVGAEPLVSALREGRTGIEPLSAFPPGDLTCVGAGEVRAVMTDKEIRNLSLPQYRKTVGKNLKYMARDIGLAVTAAQLAYADAGLADAKLDPTRFGLDLGAGLISTELDELAPTIALAHANGALDYGIWGRELRGINPLWLLKYLPNMLACHISILMDCQGPSNTITEADAASNLALGEAYRIISKGRADLMISGGADSKIHPLSLIRARMMGQISTWTGPPERGCRPFDRDRCGWIPGEAAAIFILEEREHALKRNAKIYGEILGFGAACDAHPGGGLDPQGRGTELAAGAALRNAGLGIADIGHINAHGASTVVADLAEARAFRRLQDAAGGPPVPVTALKGYFGNSVSGCGALELAASLLCIREGFVPAICNCDNPDPDVDLDLVLKTPRPVANPLILNSNLTRLGQAAAIVVRAEIGS